MSLAGRRRHRRRSGVTVTTTIARLPLPSSSLTGRRHRGVISVLEFPWLGDDAAAGGGGNSMCREGEEFVYKEGGGNGRDVRRSGVGEEDTDAVEFVTTRCGAQDDVGTADVEGVGWGIRQLGRWEGPTRALKT